MRVVLGMLFFFFSNADIKFAELKKLTWKSYNSTEILLTISRIRLIVKKKFARAVLSENFEIFIMHIAALERTEIVDISIHPLQIAEVAALQWDKALNKIPAKYSDHANVFSSYPVIELSENININKHAIKLIEEKQPSDAPIYAFSLVELETLKAYIKTYQKIRLIQPFKFPASAPIFFIKKPDGSFCLYVNYQNLNNLTIKNRYLLPLIGKTLDFLQLDLTFVYYQMRIGEGDK